MYYTEKEIMTQHEALEETYIYFEKRKQEIQQFFLEKNCCIATSSQCPFLFLLL